MINLKEKIKKLPKSSGVYFFYDKKGRVLYIGSSGSLKNRISSYWRNPDPKINIMLTEAKELKYRKTNSVLEAIFLEAELIKKYQPKYNTKLKDDKSFVIIAFSKEEFSRVWVTRLSEVSQPIDFFGPYPSARLARRALDILRKIFPVRICKNIPRRPCLEYYLKRCPAPCQKKISPASYQKNINHLKLILKGKTDLLLVKLRKEMKTASRKLDFEKALLLRNKIFALEHIKDISLLTKETATIFQGRIEAYDISNFGGKLATGSMVVFEDGELRSEEYRKFKIKNLKGGDTGMLREVLERRFLHKEWNLPCLILVDGGKAQLGTAKAVIKKYRLKIPVVAIAKSKKKKMGDKFYTDLKLLPEDKKNLSCLRDEAHRFALSYHRLLREKFLFSKAKEN